MAPIPETDGNVEWAADNQHLFYVTKDAQERYASFWDPECQTRGHIDRLFQDTHSANEHCTISPTAHTSAYGLLCKVRLCWGR